MPVYAAAKVALILALLSFNAKAEPFQIEQAAISQNSNNYALDATITYPLSSEVLEALENGIPITIVQHFQLSQSVPIIGKYWPWRWRDIIWARRLTYELRYHDLSEQYILLTAGTHKQQTFPSLRTALVALGSISDLILPSAVAVDPDAMTFEIRSELDLHALPTPMRLSALLSKKWQVASPWVVVPWP